MPSDDASGEAGATAIADHIENYWRRRGYDGISTGIVLIKDAPRLSQTTITGDPDPCYAVVSNIGPDGYPPLN